MNPDARDLTSIAWLRGDPRLAEGLVLRLPGPGGRPVVLMEASGPGAGRLLSCEVAFAAREDPVRLSFPLDALGSGREGAILALRRRGQSLGLLVDGVLVDEDWPFGPMREPSGPVEAGPAASRVEMRVAAITDGALAEACGGAAAVAARASEILGPERPVGQHWRPRGFNVRVGDCMPSLLGGRFHLFYLHDRREGCSRWGLGGHQWAHASTDDLILWEHHPLAIPLTDDDEGSICTGSVFPQGGICHAFYSVRTVDGSPAPLCVATSPDGIRFTKQPVLAKLRAPFIPKDARDPVVFRDPAGDRFHMLVTTGLAGAGPGDGAGCLARLVSRDLRRWEQVDEPFLVPGLPGQPECPDVFEWNGWHYLLFSNRSVTGYRMSRSPLGPWIRPDDPGFGGPGVCVMKTAAFAGGRRIGAAFVSDGGYAGRLVLREIRQRPDGTLFSEWPPELPAPGD